ncbi:MAG: hypothetical protein ABIS29_06250 [Vicinamibacterales bacterium]
MWRWGFEEVQTFVRKFGSNFVYSLPWVAAIFVDHSGSDLFNIPADLGGLLTLALMASLITSGGFVQMIVRRGQFYTCLHEFALARLVCNLFVRMGCIVTCLCATVGLLVGFYAGAFPSSYVFVAFIYYLLLSFLWLLCALLAVEKRSGSILVSVATPAVTYALMQTVMAASPAVAQLVAAGAGVAVAWAATRHGVLARESARRDGEMVLPRRSVLLLISAPYFIYGVGYFSFLFADRFAAGAAIPFGSGLYYGIAADYKKVMDAALLTFLASTGLVEYLNHKFMHFWYTGARSRVVHDAHAFTQALRRRHTAYSLLLTALSSLVGVLSYSVLVRSDSDNLGLIGLAVIGNLGYVLLSLALFNAVLLFSLRRPSAVLRALWPALVVHLCASYLLARAVHPRLATVGLALGSLIFVLRARKFALEAISEPDYAYYAG